MSEPVMKARCYPEILALYEELKEHRRDVHAHPELGFDTDRTVEKIVAFLQRHGITEIDTTTVKGSVIAVLTGNQPGVTVALRADIDALPMPDSTSNPWKSTFAGKAHACGHDGHQTWMLGTAAYLSAHRDFPGRVVFIFQPAEEIGLGATAIVKAGILEKYDVKEIYGGHDEPFLDKGSFGFKVGHLQASSDSFLVEFTGVGTHGGRPHKGIDPLPALAELYNAYQSIISRKVDPLEPAVLSICSMNAGRKDTYNVVPGDASLGGTVRTFSPAVRDLLEENMKRMAEGIAQAHGLKVNFQYIRLISSLNNAEVCTKAGIEEALKLVGEENVVQDMTPFMSSEDFSVYQEKIPGSIIRVGVRDENHQVSIHNPLFDFNDEVLPLASTLFVNIVKSRLAALSK